MAPLEIAGSPSRKTTAHSVHKRSESARRQQARKTRWGACPMKGRAGIIAERPYLNRFAMNGSLYARNQIFVSLAIKKSFADEGQETTIKLPFT